MAVSKEKIKKEKLYTITLSGMIPFPSVPFSFDLSEKYSMSAAKKAWDESNEIFLISAKNSSGAEPSRDILYDIGVIADIKQYIEMPDGTARVICEGRDRAELIDYNYSEEGPVSTVYRVSYESRDNDSPRVKAAVMEAQHKFEEFVKLLPRKLPKELITAVKMVEDPAILSDLIACEVLVSNEDKMSALSEYDPVRRIELISVIMEREMRILEKEDEIHKKVISKIESDQKERYLREQMRAIQEELGEDDDEIAEYRKKFSGKKLPKKVKEKVYSEISKLAKTPYSSAESSVIRNWLDICDEIPFGVYTKDSIDLDKVKKQLDRDHDGLDKVKERILEFLAVEKLTGKGSRQILCLYGPPGTGKTSICNSIAAALGRNYVRVSLGGVRDEADIRGHRKTYVASMPGRIIEGLSRSGSMNPLMLLDEVDKMTANSQGDPASALLEVLDSEQNSEFRDHFLEMPVDLSDVMFICTANTLTTVPRPLLDRMEVVQLDIYTRSEKYSIARHHLVPKQLKRNGLTSKQIKFTASGIYGIIDRYTLEAGVRNLEREIASLCRKIAYDIVEGKEESVKITSENLEKYLGPEKNRKDKEGKENEIGTANGLAYTELGGDTLKIETAIMPGDGKLQLTGSLGNVMTESARAAISYIRSRSDEIGVEEDFYKTKDIHIHVPEGAVPKDGPSAGVTIMTALVSGLTGIPTRNDTAMTGEITLRGKVLQIGGLKEKSMAAYSAGMKRVLIPEGNMPDIEECAPEVKKNIKFIPCSDAEDVLREALARGKRKRSRAPRRDGKRESAQ